MSDILLPSPLAPRVDSVLDLIGNTPMVEIRHLDTGPCRLFVKLENQNPGGSIKDRIALTMIEAAERDGRLAPGGTIVEATAGNTGLGLALVAAQKGYRLVLVVPDKMSREKTLHLAALGAEVVLTRSDVVKGQPDYYQDKAARLAAEIPGACYIDQFNNPANPLAHAAGTAPEIWAQMEQRVDAVVLGVGSGGTLGGLTRFFRAHAPDTAFVLADPAGSVLADYLKAGKIGTAGSWLVEGIGEDFVPAQADFALVREAITVSDKESFDTARDLLRHEGILAGSSSGTLVAAALRYCRAQSQPRRVVSFICDSGNKYLSKMFNKDWLAEQGLLALPEVGDITDLIAHRHDRGETIVCRPDEPLSAVYQRMHRFDISQLPVMENERVVGIVDEWDMLHAVHNRPDNFKLPVARAMTRKLEVLSPKAQLAELIAVFDHGHVALVMDDGRYLGLITQTDLLSYWRLRAFHAH